MQLESVRQIKAEVSDEIVRAAAGNAPLSTLFASSEPPSLGLGLAAKPGGGFLLAVRTDSPVVAERMRLRAKGEAHVRFVQPRAIPPVWEPPAASAMAGAAPHSPAWLQSRRRPLEAGLQVGIRGVGFVGTLGAIVRDALGVYGLSNSHVVADGGSTPLGTLIGQPFGSLPEEWIGALARFGPYSRQTPNIVDWGLVRLAKIEVAGAYNGALGDNVRGARETSPGDLGARVMKVGRTNGVQHGVISAVEIDGLTVDFGNHGLLRWNDQLEVTSLDGSPEPFSRAGDSGSAILDTAGRMVALLFAGGRDSTGRDRTFANRANSVLDAAGVELVVA